MKINQDICIGCEQCIAYCTMGAISLQDDKAYINDDECVECEVCQKLDVCPVGAIYQEELVYPRTIRSVFSNPEKPHNRTKRHGRGTEEMKTNDVTNRYQDGEIGLCLEVGRPGIGTRLRDVEKVTMALARMGIMLEEENPLFDHIENAQTGKLKDEVLEEKVLSAIVEIKEKPEVIAGVLTELKKLSAELDTVVTLSVICRVKEDGSIPDYDSLEKYGFRTNWHTKVNIGLGRISDQRGN